MHDSILLKILFLLMVAFIYSSIFASILYNRLQNTNLKFWEIIWLTFLALLGFSHFSLLVYQVYML
jgi:hypothetical protein